MLWWDRHKRVPHKKVKVEQIHCCTGNMCSQNISFRVDKPNGRSLRKGKVNSVFFAKDVRKTISLKEKQSLSKYQNK